MIELNHKTADGTILKLTAKDETGELIISLKKDDRHVGMTMAVQEFIAFLTKAAGIASIVKMSVDTKLFTVPTTGEVS